jgi:hypothetical protein
VETLRDSGYDGLDDATDDGVDSSKSLTRAAQLESGAAAAEDRGGGRTIRGRLTRWDGYSWTRRDGGDLLGGLPGYGAAAKLLPSVALTCS